MKGLEKIPEASPVPSQIQQILVRRPDTTHISKHLSRILQVFEEKRVTWAQVFFDGREAVDKDWCRPLDALDDEVVGSRIIKVTERDAAGHHPLKLITFHVRLILGIGVRGGFALSSQRLIYVEARIWRNHLLAERRGVKFAN